MVLLVLCLDVAPCMAWGVAGHRITADIARRHLTPAAARRVHELLGDVSLVDSSTWADEVRRDPAYRWSAPLHYTNIQPGADRFDMQRDCAPRGCVVSAIHRYADLLSNRLVSDRVRSEALKFLVHFVGDIHQPLHVGRARDRGGNDIRVSFFHNHTNLHRVWDSGMIRRVHKNWRAAAAEIDRHITTAQTIDWTCTGPETWATESHGLAYAFAYAIPDNAELGQDYVDRCMPVVDRQLAKSGIRLAHMLNTIFADQTDRPTILPGGPTDATASPQPRSPGDDR